MTSRTVLRAAAILVSLAAAAGAAEEPGQWRTAFIKRGFVGNFEENWLKGPGSVIRSRTPLPFSGTRVKVKVRGSHATPVTLEHLFLVRGTDDNGAVSGPRFPILFDGQPGLSTTGGDERWSDEAAVPVVAGTWYVQDSYLTPKFPYAYDVDTGFGAPKGADDQARFAAINAGSRAGILERVEVFTTDTRPGIVCWGDSITHGYSSTPNGNQRYPDQLAKLLDRPVLNLGQNGDVIQYAGGAPGIVNQLNGVDTVVFLMGINDLIGGGVKQLSDYTARATQVVQGFKGRKDHPLQVCIGTLTPASGCKDYDKKAPAIEELRQAINTWIRGGGSGADVVADFDRALADPAAPGRMKADCQSDWLHPNDHGYAAMAAAAATALRPAR